MDYPEMFSIARKHPAMYGLDGSFGQFTAFLMGIDAGNAGQFLAGFREMLVLRFGDAGDNLAWAGLVMRLAFPHWDPGVAEKLRRADPETNAIAVDMLFAVLGDFLDRRERDHGVARIFAEYMDMRRSGRGKRAGGGLR